MPPPTTLCARCLFRASTPLSRTLPRTSLIRQFSSSRPVFEPAQTTPTPTPSSSSPPSATNLPPITSALSNIKTPKAATKVAAITSMTPAGTVLKGLSYMKGKDDPVALSEEEYPEWLWGCLDVKKEEGEGDGGKVGDEFSKSKKLRRAAAKRARKLQAAALARGDMSSLVPKVPITQQSIDLPANEEGTVEGALEAERTRFELKAAMRRERRKGIKEANYLKGM